VNHIYLKTSLIIALIISFFGDIPSLLRPEYARVVPNMVKTKACIDPRERQLQIQYYHLPDEMYQEPFVKDFSNIIQKFKGINLEAINSFSVARPPKSR
jgi:hypothetical protein